MENPTGFNNELAFENWVDEVEKRLFKTEKFEAMGKGKDYIFQALCFLGNGSQQLSLATTILSDESKVSNGLKVELKAIQQQLHDFKEKLRNI